MCSQSEILVDSSESREINLERSGFYDSGRHVVVEIV